MTFKEYDRVRKALWAKERKIRFWRSLAYAFGMTLLLVIIAFFQRG